MIARVLLDLTLRKEFDYFIPEEIREAVEVGSRVKVPFGARQIMGSVTALAENTPQTKLRPILKVIGRRALITPSVMHLARWLAEYYCCSLEAALKSVLPEAVRQEASGWREQLVVRALANPRPDKQDHPPQVPGRAALPRSPLHSVEAAQQRRPTEFMVPMPSPERLEIAQAPPTSPPAKLTKRQQEIQRLVEQHGEMPLRELLDLAQTTLTTVRRLEDAGALTLTSEIAERDPYAHEVILPTQPMVLNAEQTQALAQITAAMDHQTLARGTTISSQPAQPQSPTSKNSALRTPHSAFLLHGVTGSGKTEVYLQSIAHALERGQGAIVLVPEISLTPQTVERFKARFNTGPLRTLVAVLHSHLSAGERHDEWHKIRQGRARIVIGARSAVFAPVDPLGLIIVDEEHEHSYKQEEAPRYHARDVAVKRAHDEGATVVLGSATPCLESFFNAKKGKYTLLEMPTRVDDKKMPLVRVVDMRHEAKEDKGIPIFSRRLKEAIQRRLEKNEQTILFLNRRGYAASLQCPQCGYVAGCPNCSIALTFHRRAQKLCCHICGHSAPAPGVCPEPKCRNPAIRYAGLGTQRVEETLTKLFPKARIARMDSDTMKRKEDYRRVLGQFRLGKLDILVGTQMIAKGLHFPNVTLVGIVFADLSLHVPDFRAGERTFQLLTQVAGRAGRGDVEGEVVVQSFTPFHPAIQYARRHDFAGFYEQEIEFRAQLKYPPFTRAALLTLRGRNEDKVKILSEHLKKELDKALSGFKEVILAGPAPAPLLRAETFYRYQIMLRTREMTKLSLRLAELLKKIVFPEDIRLTVDIDPASLV